MFRNWPSRGSIGSNANEAERRWDPLTVTEITDNIRSLASITDDTEEFADQSVHFGHAVVELFANSVQMDIVLPNIEECLNLVQKGC